MIEGEDEGTKLAGIAGGILGFLRVIIGDDAGCIGGSGGGAIIWRLNVGVRFKLHVGLPSLEIDEVLTPKLIIYG